jgi:hypothetical protein
MCRAIFDGSVYADHIYGSSGTATAPMVVSKTG